MLSLALSRLLVAVPTLFVIIAAAFFLMRAAPGGPFDAERQMPPEIEKRLLAAYDLDQPAPVQFMRYLGRLAQGDLGPSMKYKDKSVADLIAEGLPTSAVVGLSAVTLALLMGGSLGVLAALNQNRPQDYGVMALAIAGVCLPPLVMGPVLSLVLAVELGWFGASGLYRDQFTPYYLTLPIVTLALPQIAIISRLTRASMIEAMRSNAIRTARAKGLPEARVVWRHALPIAAVPVAAYLGPAIAQVLTGSFVIESVFALPGIGRQFVTGALQRDYTLVMGVVIVYAVLIILLNLASDLVARGLDPRARSA